VSVRFICFLGQILKQELVDGKTETILCSLTAPYFCCRAPSSSLPPDVTKAFQIIRGPKNDAGKHYDLGIINNIYLGLTMNTVLKCSFLSM
jgi:hypothetical protein